MNTGTVGSSFTPVPSYISGQTSITLTDSNGLVTGTIYAFRIYASNSQGDGEMSDETSVAVSDKPTASALITKVMS